MGRAGTKALRQEHAWQVHGPAWRPAWGQERREMSETAGVTVGQGHPKGRTFLFLKGYQEKEFVAETIRDPQG